MKKYLTELLLCVLLLLSLLTLSSCTKAKETEGVGDGGGTAADTPSQDSSDEVTPSPDADVEEIAEALAAKYAEYADLRASYDEMMAELDASDKMTYEEYLSYQLVVAPVDDPSTLMGLTSAPSGIKEACVYHPGMMGQAYIGYVFSLEEGTDVEAFKSALSDAADLRWNICTSANTVVCENAGDIVFFSMMVVKDDENPHGFTSEQKDGFISTFFDAVK